MKLETEITRIVVMGLVDRANELNHYGATKTAIHMLELSQELVQALNNMELSFSNYTHGKWKAAIDMGLDNIAPQ